jgi:hypothetical protein
MNIAVPGTEEPSGIFFWAHANGGTPNSMTQAEADAALDNGYAVVSWGSVGKLQGYEIIQTGWADSQVVFDYVRANAATWNMDPDRIIIGGRSRGSIVSWMLAHGGHPAITGIYMYNALPRGVWPSNVWTDAITADSPPIYLVYGPEWGSSDGHAPDNVLPVRDAYTALGMSDEFTLYEDMWGNFRDDNNNWTNEYTTHHYFPELAASLSDDDSVTWGNFPMDENGWVDTGSFIGWINATSAPWLWSASLESWLYLLETSLSEAGAWTYILR